MATDTGSPVDPTIFTTSEMMIEEIEAIKRRLYTPLVFVLPVRPDLVSKELYEECMAALQRAIKDHGY